MQSVKAFPDFVIVLPDKVKEEETEGGIILPEQRKDIPQLGTVIDSGVDFVKKDMRIYFRMWAGDPVKVSRNEEYLAVYYKDLLAYIEE